MGGAVTWNLTMLKEEAMLAAVDCVVAAVVHVVVTSIAMTT